MSGIAITFACVYVLTVVFSFAGLYFQHKQIRIQNEHLGLMRKSYEDLWQDREAHIKNWERQCRTIQKLNDELYRMQEELACWRCLNKELKQELATIAAAYTATHMPAERSLDLS